MRDFLNTYTAYKRKNGRTVVFRSRLEAKWAFIFDSLNYEWSYEPCHVKLPFSRFYIPDFFIRGIGFLEIKPNPKFLIEESFQKINEASSAVSKLKSSNRIISLSFPAPSFGFYSLDPSLILWDEKGSRKINRVEFLSLISNQNPYLKERSFDSLNSLLEGLIRQSNFIEEQPIKLSKVVTKLIIENSINSTDEILAWELRGTIERKTLSNIINDTFIEPTYTLKKFVSRALV
jgi:hypothetical protein